MSSWQLAPVLQRDDWLSSRHRPECHRDSGGSLLVPILCGWRVLSWFGAPGVRHNLLDAVQPSKSSVLSPKVAPSTRAVGPYLFALRAEDCRFSFCFLCPSCARSLLKAAFKKSSSEHLRCLKTCFLSKKGLVAGFVLRWSNFPPPARRSALLPRALGAGASPSTPGVQQTLTGGWCTLSLASWH